MVEVFREVKRVLRDDGTVWANWGDSYVSNASNQVPQTKNHQGCGFAGPNRSGKTGLKPKDQMLIPHRVAVALQADGWWVRDTIIWHKRNPMPASVTDRTTCAHEYIFLLTKSARYWYDAEAIREKGQTYIRKASGYVGFDATHIGNNQKGGFADKDTITSGRNKRSVWTVSTAPFRGCHFATFPPKLIEPMILAGCPAKCCPVCGAGWVRVVERGQSTGTDGKQDNSGVTLRNDALRHSGRIGERESKTLGFQPSCQCNAPDHVPGTVLDPFGGSGTTAYVANAYGRNAILCELNPEYEPLIRERLNMPYEVEQEERKPEQLELFA
jgi:DNA modification methylase